MNYTNYPHTFRVFQFGFSLLEVLLATALMSYGMVKIADLTKSSSDDIKQLNAASHMQRIVLALHEYAQQQNASLLSTLSSTSYTTVDVNSLISGGYLPPGFNSLNSIGQSVQGQFISAGNYGVIGLAYTTGGTGLTSVQAAALANKLGAKGGWVNSVSALSIVNGKTTTVYKNYLKGSGNAWILDLNITPYNNFTNLQSNQVVAYLNMDTGMGSPTDNDFVRRHPVSGQPELNTMATSLKLFNAASVVSGATDVVGTSCSQYGLNSIATNYTGEVISCQQVDSSLLWQPAVKSYWKPPVASFASLPTITCSAASGFCAHANNIGDMRLETSKFNTYTWTGTEWKPLIANDEGNVNISGSLIVASNAMFYNGIEVISGGLVFAPTSSNPNIIANSGLYISAGTIETASWINTNGFKITYAASVNAPCNTYNRMFARDSNSPQWLFCKYDPTMTAVQWNGKWAVINFP